MKFGIIERALTAGLTATTSTLVQQFPLKAEGLNNNRLSDTGRNQISQTTLPRVPIQSAQISPQEKERICTEAKSSLTEITSRINQLRQKGIPEALEAYDSAEKILRQTQKNDPKYQSIFNNFTVTALNLNSQQSQLATYIATLPLAVNNVNRACN